MNLYRMFALGNDPFPALRSCWELWQKAEREARIAYQLAIHRSRTRDR